MWTLTMKSESTLDLRILNGHPVSEKRYVGHRRISNPLSADKDTRVSSSLRILWMHQRIKHESLCAVVTIFRLHFYFNFKNKKSSISSHKGSFSTCKFKKGGKINS